jgi:uncharacterized protein (DUF983 family)
MERLSNRPKSGLMAVIEAKCPRCRKGNMFAYNSWMPSRFTKMNQDCPHCGLHFEPEPGFYIGAMYVSYAFGVAVVAIVFVVLNVFFDSPPTWEYMVVISCLLLLIVPPSYRYSRVLYLHWFGGIRFNKSDWFK